MCFVYHRPQDAGDVDDILQTHGADARVLAGGTDLLVQVRAGIQQLQHVIDITGLEELSFLQPEGSRLRIGAGAPMWKLTENPLVRTRFVALAEAARSVGSKQIQNRATVVGNICNASPAADTGPALLIYDAVVGIRSAAGRRRLPLGQFWLGPRLTALEPHEWVEYVELEDPGFHGSCYVKLGRTRGVDIALVGAAVMANEDGFRLAYASVAPTVRRTPRAETALDPALGESQTWETVERQLAAEIAPIDDLRASARYRSAMALVCTRRGVALAHHRFTSETESDG